MNQINYIVEVHNFACGNEIVHKYIFYSLTFFPLYIPSWYIHFMFLRWLAIWRTACFFRFFRKFTCKVSKPSNTCTESKFITNIKWWKLSQSENFSAMSVIERQQFIWSCTLGMVDWQRKITTKKMHAWMLYI